LQDADPGGTWSIPSGALGKGETPEAGALREAVEEIGALPQHLTHQYTVVSTDCGNWKFHTVVMGAGVPFLPRGGGKTGHETAGTAWHTAAGITKLKEAGQLHPAFAASWDLVRRPPGPGAEAAAASMTGRVTRSQWAELVHRLSEGDLRSAGGYHGTHRKLRPGELVEPGHEANSEASEPGHVYFTDDAFRAN